MSPEADSYIAFVARASLCGDSAEVTCQDGVLRIVFSFAPPWWDIPQDPSEDLRPSHGGAGMIVWKEETTEQKVKILEQMVKDLEEQAETRAGALEGAQNIIRQLRDANSGVVA